MIEKQEIVDGNKLLAEFLGYRYIPFNNDEGLKAGWWKCMDNRTMKIIQSSESTVRKSGNSFFLCRRHTELRFFNCWNHLFMVINKIHRLDLKDSFYKWDGMEELGQDPVQHNFMCTTVDIDRFGCFVGIDLQLDPVLKISYVEVDDETPPRIATFKALVEFVKWYNEKI